MHTHTGVTSCRHCICQEGKRSDIVRGPRPSTISEQLASGSSRAQARPTPSSVSAVRARRQQTTGDRGCGSVGSTADPFQLREKKHTQVSLEGRCEGDKQARGQLGGWSHRPCPSRCQWLCPQHRAAWMKGQWPAPAPLTTLQEGSIGCPFCNPSYCSATAARMWCQAHRTSSGGL